MPAKDTLPRRIFRAFRNGVLYALCAWAAMSVTGGPSFSHHHLSDFLYYLGWAAATGYYFGWSDARPRRKRR